MNRIEKSFTSARDEGRAAFIAYVCAGDPDWETSLKVCRTLIEGGADMLELGMPFSDPLADGLTNQLAADRALKSGMNQSKVLDLVREIRKFSEVPIIFYTYFNLVHSQGEYVYTKRAREAGADAILTLDLPPEEAEEMEKACAEAGLQTVYIVAPTSPEERIRKICGHTTGFVYYVSQEGVTGERKEMAGNLKEKVDTIRAHTSQPVVVGFGISNREHVHTVAQVADGAVVGSALVNCIARHIGDRGAILQDLQAKLDELTPGLKVGQGAGRH